MTNPQPQPQTPPFFELAPAWAREMFKALVTHIDASVQQQLSLTSQEEGAVMTAVQVQQEDLDKFATDLETAVSAVAAEIQALQLPAGSTANLDQALKDLQALEPPAAPVPAPAPAPTPTPPAG